MKKLMFLFILCFSVSQVSALYVPKDLYIPEDVITKGDKAEVKKYLIAFLEKYKLSASRENLYELRKCQFFAYSSQQLSIGGLIAYACFEIEEAQKSKSKSLENVILEISNF